MVALMVVLTIIVFVTIDYFIQKKKQIGFAAERTISRMPLSKIFDLIPKGIFVQPTLTWSKLLDSGELVLGIHPVLMGMIGEPDEIELIKVGESIEKGDVMAVVKKGNRVLRIKSPIRGRVIGLNEELMADPTWENVSHNWVYMLEPQNVAQEIPNWLVAEKAYQWTRDRYQQIKQFFMSLLPQTQAGVTMADGGDIPVGILSEFDEKVWNEFEKKFCEMSA